MKMRKTIQLCLAGFLVIAISWGFFALQGKNTAHAQNIEDIFESVLGEIDRATKQNIRTQNKSETREVITEEIVVEKEIAAKTTTVTQSDGTIIATTENTDGTTTTTTTTTAATTTTTATATCNFSGTYVGRTNDSDDIDIALTQTGLTITGSGTIDEVEFGIAPLTFSGTVDCNTNIYTFSGTEGGTCPSTFSGSGTFAADGSTFTFSVSGSDCQGAFTDSGTLTKS